jgi:hypothetical protein
MNKSQPKVKREIPKKARRMHIHLQYVLTNKKGEFTSDSDESLAMAWLQEKLIHLHFSLFLKFHCEYKRRRNGNLATSFIWLKYFIMQMFPMHKVECPN